MDRTLRLRRDTLTELATTDLANVVGAQLITQYCNTLDFCHVPTLPVRDCIR